MKRSGILAVATLSILCIASTRGPGKVGYYGPPDGLYLDRPAGYAYLPYECPGQIPNSPKATVVMLFHDGYEGTTTYVTALLDSIRNGTGVWADSSFAGADIRFSTFIEPEEVDTGGFVTIATLRSLNQTYYEVGTHGDDTQRLGSQGLDSGGSAVAYGGVTGRSKLFIQTYLAGAQDSLLAWGLPKARSHVYANWWMTPGEDDIWRAAGYHQAAGKAVGVGLGYTTVQAGTVPMQRNVDEFTPAVFNRGGNMDYYGFHTIGERFDDFDIGSGIFVTASGAGGAATVDSLKMRLDMAERFGDQFWIGFHQVDDDTTGQTLYCSKGAFRTWAIYLASAISEGVAQSKTMEQATDILRGRRQGPLVPHHGFRLLADNTYKSADSGLVTPLGFIPPMGANYFFNSPGADTIVAAGGTATRGKVVSFRSADTVFASYDSLSGADSVSYGVADTSANYIVYQMNNTTFSQDLVNVIRVTGCRARYVRLSVQVMPLAANGWDQDVYLLCKAGQFTEDFMNNVNSGPAAYTAMRDCVKRRGQSPDPTNVAWQRQRVFPQFNPFAGDTSQSVTAAGYSNLGVMYPWAHFTLNPYIMDSQATIGWDFMASFGDQDSLTAANVAQDSHSNNWSGISANYPIDSVFYIPVDQNTDYLYVVTAVEAVNAISAAGSFVYLGYQAEPIP